MREETERRVAAAQLDGKRAVQAQRAGEALLEARLKEATACADRAGREAESRLRTARAEREGLALALADASRRANQQAACLHQLTLQTEVAPPRRLDRLHLSDLSLSSTVWTGPPVQPITIHIAYPMLHPPYTPPPLWNQQRARRHTLALHLPCPHPAPSIPPPPP